MNDHRTQLEQLALRECQRLFDEQRKASDSFDGGFGRFPRRAIIRFREPGDNGAVIRAWTLSDDGSLSEAPADTQPEAKRDGMYYADGLFAFSVSDSGMSVWIDMILGPRFGRGFEYRVSCAYGKPKLGEQMVLWVS